MRIGMGSSQKKFQRYRPINDIMRTIFVFGFMIMGKELLADLNLAIFKIWLDTRPKMEIHDPNVYPTILGGVSLGFWGLLEALGARSAIFWHLKTGTFGKKFFLAQASGQCHHNHKELMNTSMIIGH